MAKLQAMFRRVGYLQVGLFVGALGLIDLILLLTPGPQEIVQVVPLHEGRVFTWDLLLVAIGAALLFLWRRRPGMRVARLLVFGMTLAVLLSAGLTLVALVVARTRGI